MRGLVAAAALAVLIAGCSGTSDEDVVGQNDVPASGPASVGPVDVDPEAQRILEAALAPLVEERSTAFQAVGHAGTALLYSVQGLADAGTPGWWAMAYPYQPGRPPTEARVMDARSVADKVWMTFEDWPKNQRGCWLPMQTPTERPFGLGALQPTEPAYISALGDLQARGFRDSSRTLLDASLGLQAAMGMQTAQLHRALRLADTNLSGQRIQVLVGVEKGRLTELRVDGADLRASLEAAGVPMEAAVAEVVGPLRLKVSYAAGEAAERIQPPKLVVGSGRCRSGQFANPDGG